MTNSARKPLLVLAVFLIFFGSGFTANNSHNTTSAPMISGRQEAAHIYAGNNNAFFNPLGIPELRTPPPFSPPVVVDAQIPQIVTAPDPRYEPMSNPHREIFVPASESRPPQPSLSLPLTENIPPYRYDMNEWEEKRIFSSNLYTDTGVYSTWIDGDKHLSSRDEGQFYEKNYRYELFSTRSNGDSLAMNFDATYTNDKRPYRDGFTLNQATVDSRTARSRLVLGHAFPEMSEMTMTQHLLGIYGRQEFDYTSVSGFGGYYALDKDDLKNPRYVGGLRLEHARDKGFKVGLNLVGTEDQRDNAAATDIMPELSNQVVSIDMKMKPTENIFVNAEMAHSQTDFDKRTPSSEQNGDAYSLRAGYQRENYNLEAGFEQADTGFLSPLGQTPRDERAYFARFYYQLNNYISTRFSQRISRDNLDNYQRSTIIREQPEVQITLKPSEYYKHMRIDFFYQPLHEYSRNSGFMKRYRDLLWLEFNHQAGQMLYYAGLSQTIDKDDVNVLNDRDIQRFDFNLTWEFNRLNRIYTSVAVEKLSYKRAGGMDETSWFGFGGSSRFHENILISLDYLRENVSPIGISSNHDRVNISLTREYSPTSRLILGLEGNRSRFSQNAGEFDDYTAKLRYLKAF